MSRRIRYRTLPVVGLTFAALAAAPALAQEIGGGTEQAAQTANDTADQARAGDIVVTARRRDERLLDTPVAITAFTGAQLEKQGEIDITEVAQSTPNVTLEPSRGTNTKLHAYIGRAPCREKVSQYGCITVVAYHLKNKK